MPEHLLVTTQWLHDHLSDPDLRIVDIRGHVLPASEPLPHYYNHYDDYVKAHIPGAVFVDWVKEITDPTDPRHAQIAKPDRYAAVMNRIGVGENTFVVAYDDAGGMFGARLWWSLNYYGHKQVAVLDGGWQKWIAEGRPTTAEVPTIQPVQFTPRPNAALRRTGAEVQAQLEGAQRLIDVRTPAEFKGEASRAARKGHIPTAANLPRTSLLDSSGAMLPPETLREIFAAAGVDENSTDVVFYCNGGVSASYGLLALRAAGFEGGSVYDGSWKDWGNDPDKPIESE
jgi:thiosulfate/3-mercaptopyruvate sulfurtransferase